MTHSQPKFNLVDEAWIPVADHGLASLRDIFSNPELRSLGGNPIQKIAVTKLLLAIAQAAHTPADDEEWNNLGANGLAQKTLAYLNANNDAFWLYGDKPFLQMPAIQKVVEILRLADKKNIKKLDPCEFSNGDFPNLLAENNTLFKQRDFQRMETDAEKTLFLVTIMSFALSGKQHNHRIVLDPDMEEKGQKAASGPSLGAKGYLHSYVLGSTILETIHLNVFSHEEIAQMKFLTEQVGTPPWEIMPLHETCPVAVKNQNSLLGMLLPVSRFILFQKNSLHYTEGMKYPDSNAGWHEPTMAVKPLASGKFDIISAKTDRKPWRDLTALLAFVAQQQGDYTCRQLASGVRKAKMVGCPVMSIWSGGLEAKGDSFGQKISGKNDYVESLVSIPTSEFGEYWFQILKEEMKALEQMAKIAERSTENYIKQILSQKNKASDHAKNQGKRASELFWELAEQSFQQLIDACNTPNTREKDSLRLLFIRYANQTYDAHAPRETARQLEAWAANRPNLAKFYPPKQDQQPTP